MSDILISSILKNFFKIVFSFLLLSFFLYIISPFLISIVLAGILALALIPFVDYFIRKGFKRKTSVLIFTLLSAFIGMIPIVAFFIHGSKVLSKLLLDASMSHLSERFSSSSYKLLDSFSSFYGLDHTMIRGKFATLLVYAGNSMAGTFNTFVGEAPTIMMMGAVTSLALYCFLRESDKIRRLFDRYFYFNHVNGNKFIMMFKVCCREVFFSNIITGLVQATLVTAGALIFGVGDIFLVFFITFVFSFVPIIGSGPVAAVLAVSCFMDARLGAGAGMLITATVAGVSDNVLRPWLGSLGEVKVHPFIGLLGVIGGVLMFGLPGLFIGPLIVSLSFGALPIIIEEYFPPNTLLVPDLHSTLSRNHHTEDDHMTSLENV